MRVFLDTNVLVGAFAARGLCADLLRGILSGHDLVVGEVVLEELARVLRDRIGLPAGAGEEIERFLRGYEVVPRPGSHLALGLRDADDEWIVASAVAGGADMLVTGDADILTGGAAMPVPVLTPRQAWKALHAS